MYAGSATQTCGFAAKARRGMLGMGSFESTRLAYERSVFRTNPAAARRCANIGSSGHGLECLAGMQAGSARDIVRIPATG
jgi:hypothetical protein